MKKALLVLHQKTSEAGDLGVKLIKRGYNLVYLRPPLGDELPQDLKQYSVVVIFGGPMSANDNDEFIKKEIDWIKFVINSNVPFLGICLGAQILAKHLGCKIEKNYKKLSEIGFYKINPTSNGLKLFESQSIFYQFHTEGFEIPTGCQLLARGEVFQNQAFKYQNCYALQFHPEVNFILHLKWIILVLIKKPKTLFHAGSQNLFYQFYLRFKYNKSVSEWLDSFFDNYFLATK